MYVQKKFGEWNLGIRLHVGVHVHARTCSTFIMEGLSRHIYHTVMSGFHTECVCVCGGGWGGRGGGREG